jgi:hypothetical protein
MLTKLRLKRLSLLSLLALESVALEYLLCYYQFRILIFGVVLLPFNLTFSKTLWGVGHPLHEPMTVISSLKTSFSYS